MKPDKPKPNFRYVDRLEFLRLQKAGLIQTLHMNGEAVYRIKTKDGQFDFSDLYKTVAFHKNGQFEIPDKVPKKNQHPGWQVVEKHRINGIEIALWCSPSGKRGRFYYNKTIMHKGSYDFVTEQYFAFLSAMQIEMDEDFE